ncbi:hypothetical protein [Spirosoma jeollabukense]
MKPDRRQIVKSVSVRARRLDQRAYQGSFAHPPSPVDVLDLPDIDAPEFTIPATFPNPVCPGCHDQTD